MKHEIIIFFVEEVLVELSFYFCYFFHSTLNKTNFVVNIFQQQFMMMEFTLSQRERKGKKLFTKLSFVYSFSFIREYGIKNCFVYINIKIHGKMTTRQDDMAMHWCVDHFPIDNWTKEWWKVIPKWDFWFRSVLFLVVVAVFDIIQYESKLAELASCAWTRKCVERQFTES